MPTWFWKRGNSSTTTKKTLVISAESDAEDLKLATVAPVARLEGLFPHQMDSGIFYKKRYVGSLSFLLKGQKERWYAALLPTRSSQITRPSGDTPEALPHSHWRWRATRSSSRDTWGGKDHSHTEKERVQCPHTEKERERERERAVSSHQERERERERESAVSSHLAVICHPQCTLRELNGAIGYHTLRSTNTAVYLFIYFFPVLIFYYIFFK